MASSDNSTNVSIPIPQYHVQKDLATSYLTEEEKSQADTLHFWDGERKIDIVLAFEDDENGPEDIRKAEKRKTFQRNLEEQGLELELEPSHRSADKKTNFLKVSAPWELLAKYAEILNLKMPIKEEGISELDDKVGGCCKVLSPFDYDHDLIPPEPNFFTAGFSMEKEDSFIVKDRETFFSSAQRSQIVWQILMRTSYDDDEDDKVGIRRLLSNGTYVAAYPLHDGKPTKDDNSGARCSRRILYMEWARPCTWFKKQPLWLIKRYFGDKVGLYFAWLGFYTTMLIPPAIAGVLVVLYGLLTVDSDNNHPSEEICDNSLVNGSTIFDGNATAWLCPNCATHCPFTKLDKSCLLSKVSYVIDNEATIVFAIFMSFWATAFIEFWKRRQAVIAWEWDLTNFEEEEQTRPEFEASVKTTRINPVTKKPEPYLPTWNKCYRVTATWSVVLFMLCSVLIAVIAIIIYRVSVTLIMYQVASRWDDKPQFLTVSNTKLLISMSAACMNLLVIIIFNKIYQRVALWLTKMEHPRTQTDFEDNFTFKIFFFQTINFYASLIYIAFFKDKFFNSPKDFAADDAFETMKGDRCDPAGCMYELFLQLAIIMVGKQFLNQFIEILIPRLTIIWKRYIYRKNVEDGEEKTIYTRWEQDYNLQNIDQLDLVDEYLEMVIQYGFITLFVAAFPLAPLFALINNVIEIRVDAYKYVTTLRRPLAQRVENIGAWANILQTLTYISVFTNGLVIALTSDFIPRLVYMFTTQEVGDSNAGMSLKGYIRWSLSEFKISDWGSPGDPDYLGPSEDVLDHSQPQINNASGDNYIDTCFFKAHRDTTADGTYPFNTSAYHIWMAKLAFVLIFQNTVMGLTALFASLVPDVPNSVKVQVQRENLLAREVLFESDIKTTSEKRGNTNQTTGSPKSNTHFLNHS